MISVSDELGRYARVLHQFVSSEHHKEVKIASFRKSFFY